MRRGIVATAVAASLALAATACGGGSGDSSDGPVTITWWDTSNATNEAPTYQALVLCWRNGQRSPIHNHRGSRCGVKILRGTATETIFARAPNGMVVPDRTRWVPPGDISASEDADIHQVSNLQPGGADLVTLHVYSPPLLRMEVFSLDTPAVREWDDPVYDRFVLGGGI